MHAFICILRETTFCTSAALSRLMRVRASVLGSGELAYDPSRAAHDRQCRGALGIDVSQCGAPADRCLPSCFVS